MSRSGNQRSVRFLIGVVALTLAVTIVFFSAAPALSCSRASGAAAECVVSARALGLVTVAEDRVSGVDSAEMVASSTTRDSDSTPPRIMFVSSGTRHDLGYFSQLFASEWQAVDAFARNPAAPELQLVKPVTARTFGSRRGSLSGGGRPRDARHGRSSLVLTAEPQ